MGSLDPILIRRASRASGDDAPSCYCRGRGVGSYPRPVKPRGKLCSRKYVVLFPVRVVTSRLSLSDGLIELYFSYSRTKEALVAIQKEKGPGRRARISGVRPRDRAAARLGHSSPQLASGAAAVEQAAALRLHPAPAPDAGHHRESACSTRPAAKQFRISRLAHGRGRQPRGLLQRPTLQEARAGRVYYGPVYFRKESEPYMTLAVAGSGQDGGVIAVDVNLKFIWDVVSQIKISRAGQAFVVDGQGALIAHPDISLVLQKTNLSGLDHVKAALGAPPRRRPRSAPRTISRGEQSPDRERDHPPARLDGLRRAAAGEDPGAGARSATAPRSSSAGHGALTWWPACSWRGDESGPIRALQAGAGRWGRVSWASGSTVRTGDGLQALAEQFNSMAARLQESYANLEQKEWTRGRGTSPRPWSAQTATAHILRVISSSPTQPPARLRRHHRERGAPLRQHVYGAAVRVEDGLVHTRRRLRPERSVLAEIRRHYPRRLDEEGPALRALRERRVVRDARLRDGGGRPVLGPRGESASRVPERAVGPHAPR